MKNIPFDTKATEATKAVMYAVWGPDTNHPTPLFESPPRVIRSI